MKFALAAFAAATALFALPAAAQMNMSASNLYVGATIGASRLGGACNDATAQGLSSCDNEDTAWRALVGYQFNPMFSAELGYHDVGTLEVATPAGATGSADVKLWELVAVAAYPIQQFNVYGKLGGYRAKTSSSGVLSGADDSNSGWTWAAGAGWEPMKNLGLRIEYQRYVDIGNSSSSVDANVASIGVLWRFR